jgi:hypothetical protein
MLGVWSRYQVWREGWGAARTGFAFGEGIYFLVRAPLPMVAAPIKAAI